MPAHAHDGDPERTAHALARLAIVVPVGPGESIAAPLRAQLAALPSTTDLHVVCAADVDAARLRALTVAAGGPRWRVAIAARGRALQQNAGARAADRPWLWFLHADSLLAPSTVPALVAFLEADAPTLGYFDLRFHDGPALMRLNEAGAWVRSRILGLPFGDQGFVVPRTAFAALGGFDATVARGEDHDLVWRARRAGVAVHALGAPLLTSARAYAVHGWLRTTAWHLAETWRQARRFARSEAPS